MNIAEGMMERFDTHNEDMLVLFRTELFRTAIPVNLLPSLIRVDCGCLILAKKRLLPRPQRRAKLDM